MKYYGLKQNNPFFLLILLFVPFISFGQNEFGTNSQIIESKWGKSGDSTSANNFIGTVNNSPLIFRTNNYERFRVSEDGRIGMGTINPLRTLEVNGDVGIDGSLYLTNLDSLSFLGQQSIGTILMINNDKVTKTSIDALRKMMYFPPLPEPPFTVCDLAGHPLQQDPAWFSSPYKLYTMCPDINVGIGTNSPEYTLDVKGSSNISGTSHAYRLKVGKKDVASSLITGYWSGTPSTNFNLIDLGHYNAQNQNGTSIFRLRSDGQLLLNGILNVERKTNEQFFVLKNSQTNNDIFLADAKGNFRINNGNRDVFYVEASTETVKARKVVVDENNWPDYVFDDDYNLLPLSKLKEYISINGRLPNLPSAEEVEDKGLDVGEANRLLVEKVEELTLYILQLEDRINKLEESKD